MESVWGFQREDEDFSTASCPLPLGHTMAGTWLGSAPLPVSLLPVVHALRWYETVSGLT